MVGRSLLRWMLLLTTARRWDDVPSSPSIFVCSMIVEAKRVTFFYILHKRRKDMWKRELSSTVCLCVRVSRVWMPNQPGHKEVRGNGWSGRVVLPTACLAALGVFIFVISTQVNFHFYSSSESWFYCASTQVPLDCYFCSKLGVQYRSHTNLQ